MDRIACESVRRAQILLNHFDIPFDKNGLIRLDDAHEDAATDRVVTALQAGEDVALVSDAGTPLISDPGFLVVRKSFDLGIHVVPVSGPSSITTIASVSPIPLNQFQFVGFLKTSGSTRRKQLFELGASTVPTIFFETANRMLAVLEVMQELGLGNRDLCLGRELTKTYEELLYGTVDQVREELGDRGEVLGEFVGVLGGSDDSSSHRNADELIQQLLPHLQVPQIARIVANLTDLDRRTAYQRAMELRS